VPFSLPTIQKAITSSVNTDNVPQKRNLVCSIRSEYISSNTVSSLFIQCFLTRYSCQINSTSMVMKEQAFFLYAHIPKRQLCLYQQYPWIEEWSIKHQLTNYVPKNIALIVIFFWAQWSWINVAGWGSNQEFIKILKLKEVNFSSVICGIIIAHSLQELPFGIFFVFSSCFQLMVSWSVLWCCASALDDYHSQWHIVSSILEKEDSFQIPRSISPSSCLPFDFTNLFWLNNKTKSLVWCNESVLNDGIVLSVFTQENPVWIAVWF